MSKCLYCGKEIQTKSHHKSGERKYCSNECYKKARDCKEYGIAVCMYCGKEFKETRDRPNKFCSKSCAARHTAEQRAIEKITEERVNPETLKRFNELTEELKTIQYLLAYERQCKYCGQWFNSKEVQRKDYCSGDCARKADNNRRDKRIWRNGKPDLTITLTKLYMRDGGVCQICGKHIDFDCDINSADYPTIDHIKPLSKGGLHHWNNVQLACRRCNTIKSDDY